MKFKLILVLVLVLSITSCTPLKGIFGKSSSKIKAQSQRIESVQKSQAQNTVAKLDQVAILASGTDYALNKVTNTEPATGVAIDINKRVISLAGKPNIDAEKAMWKTVDQLTSELDAVKKAGAKTLADKDNEISKLQLQTRQLEQDKDDEYIKYTKLASSTALLADTRGAELSKMDSMMGLGAVYYGIKRFISRSMWILGIGAIVFLFIRFAAASNPIIAAILKVFEYIGSVFVRGIQIILPKAVALAGNVSKKLYDASSMLLTKIVDQIQFIRELEKKTGRDITLKEVLVELDKSLDKSEKDMVDEIKKELNY